MQDKPEKPFFDKDNLELVKEAALEKKSLMTSIYEITGKRKFKGDKSEIDEFIAYLDIRQPYFDDLEKLDIKTGNVLREFVIDQKNENQVYRTISQILSEVKELSRKIVEIDKANNEKMQELTNSLMSDVKTISKTKKVRNSYMVFQNNQ